MINRRTLLRSAFAALGSLLVPWKVEEPVVHVLYYRGGDVSRCVGRFASFHEAEEHARISEIPTYFSSVCIATVRGNDIVGWCEYGLEHAPC